MTMIVLDEKLILVISIIFFSQNDFLLVDFFHILVSKSKIHQMKILSPFLKLRLQPLPLDYQRDKTARTIVSLRTTAVKIIRDNVLNLIQLESFMGLLEMIPKSRIKL